MQYKFFLLIIGDVFFAVAAWYFGFLMRFGSVWSASQLAAKPLASLYIFVFVLVLTSYVFDVYNFSSHRNKKEIIKNVFVAVSISFGILSVIYFIAPKLMIGRGLLVLSLATFVTYQFCWHTLFRVIIGHPFLAEKVLVYGSGEPALKVGEFVRSSNINLGRILVGYIADESESEPIAVPEEQIIGGVGNLTSVALREKVSHIVVSVPKRRVGENLQLQNILLNCKLLGIEILDAPTFLEPLTGKLMLEDMNINWLIFANGFRITSLKSAIKRVVDILLSFMGIVLSLPFYPFIALLVKLDSPGPVFFRQTRVGQGGKNFTLYKFRTMPQDVEKETGAVWAQENDPRVRPIGGFLRKCRLDELPQLFNVLKGDMSFVGPRPERPEFVAELDRQIPFYAKRHFIKPGITGWAQVKYSYGSSVEDAYEKLRYDLYYFKNMSLLQDIIIILKTFRVIIFGRGR